ncbi:MAG: ATP-binding protein, partial [Bacteroidota bacterium]
MAKSQDDFLRELLADFKIEAAEHQHVIAECMLLLEKQPPPGEYQKIVETTFRELHSLKGAARAVNQGDIERLCQAMEGVFHQLKEGRALLTPTLFDLLFNGADVLNTLLSGQGSRTNNLPQLLKAIENQVDVINLDQQSATSEHAFTLQQVETTASDGESKVAVSTTQYEPVSNEQQTQKETVRIATSKLNSILRQSEEFISARAELDYYIREMDRLNHPELQLLRRDLVKFNHTFSRMVDELGHDIRNTLLFPFSSLTDIVPMIVRDLGREFGKEIELSITGAETEIDRRILEGMKDPLIHLIRNCIDHGIEKPDVRIKNGKPARGTIKISISQESGRKVDIVLCDDGAGIDREKLRESALKNSVVSSQNLDQMNDQEILNLIFRSGVTTSPMITDLSGRGLGMAIVAAKVEGLGGSITIESEAGQGTSFVISLPLSLSTFRGVVVRVFSQLFVVPTSAIERVIRINTHDIMYAESKPLLSLNGENIALIKLADTLGLTERRQRQTNEFNF